MSKTKARTIIRIELDLNDNTDLKEALMCVHEFIATHTTHYNSHKLQSFKTAGYCGSTIKLLDGWSVRVYSDD